MSLLALINYYNINNAGGVEPPELNVDSLSPWKVLVLAQCIFLLIVEWQLIVRPGIRWIKEHGAPGLLKLCTRKNKVSPPAGGGVSLPNDNNPTANDPQIETNEHQIDTHDSDTNPPTDINHATNDPMTPSSSTDINHATNDPMTPSSSMNNPVNPWNSPLGARFRAIWSNNFSSHQSADN